MIRRISVLAAGLLVAGSLVATTPGGEPAAKAALGPIQAITLTAADFQPRSDQEAFSNTGYRLSSEGIHLARIPFPEPTVVITSVKVRVYDSATGDLCMELHRSVPAEAAHDLLASECTSGSSAENPQTLTLRAVFTRVGEYHTAYLRADFDALNFDLKLYGATVFYRVVT